MNNQQRNALKARAHHLKPLIRVGQKGITDNLLSETDQTLESHELIKIHIAADDRETRRSYAATIAEACHAELIHQIGKTFILYRQKPAS